MAYNADGNFSTFTFSGDSGGAKYLFTLKIDWETGVVTATAEEGSLSLNALFWDFKDGGTSNFSFKPEDPEINMNGDDDGNTMWDASTYLDPAGQPFPYGIGAKGSTNEAWGSSHTFNIYQAYASIGLRVYDSVAQKYSDITDTGAIQSYFDGIDKERLLVGVRATTVNNGGSIKDVSDDELDPPTPSLSVQKAVSEISDTDDYCDNHSGNYPESPVVDSEDDLITYAITVTNTGEIALSSVWIEDLNLAFAMDEDESTEDSVEVQVVYTSPDGDDITAYAEIVKEQVGEAFRYRVLLDGLDYSSAQDAQQAKAVVTYTVPATKDQILNGGNIVNTVFAQGKSADGSKTNLVSSEAKVGIDQCPDVALYKKATVATEGDSRVGLNDLITYTLKVVNEGNADLFNIAVVDALFAAAEPESIEIDGGPADFDGDGSLIISKLGFGESVDITFKYKITQGDIDNSVRECELGVETPLAAGECCKIAEFVNQAEAALEGDENAANNTGLVATPVDYSPEISLVKSVDTSLVRQVDDQIHYALNIANEGNVTLMDVLVADAFFAKALDLQVSVDGELVDDVDLVDLDADGAVDGINLARLDVGSSVEIAYDYIVTSDDVKAVYDGCNDIVGGVEFFKNTATATASEETLDCDPVSASDSVAVDLLIGPGVRTPGFWVNWTEVWNGSTSDDGKFSGKPNFPVSDILTGERSDPSLYGDSSAYLCIGDWNGNGIIDAESEKGFTWSVGTALKVLNASQKIQKDTRYVLGRDVVATWLNYLAGNSVCKSTLDGAIGWLDDYARDRSDSPFLGDVIPASSVSWASVGSDLHKSLDSFNNTGICDGVQLAVYGG